MLLFVDNEDPLYYDAYHLCCTVFDDIESFGHVYDETPYCVVYTDKDCDGERVLGCIIYKIGDRSGIGSCLNLCYVCVHPDYHRRGIGQKLLQSVITDNPSAAFMLHVSIKNEPAVGLYKKHGFVVDEMIENCYPETKGIYVGDGCHAYIMVRPRSADEANNESAVKSNHSNS